MGGDINECDWYHIMKCQLLKDLLNDESISSKWPMHYVI